MDADGRPQTCARGAGRPPRRSTARSGPYVLEGVHPAEGVLVGWLWVGPGPMFLERYGVRDLARARWLSQITVRDELCGRGYGQALLAALHEHLAAEGVDVLYLRVYDWNTAARRL